MVEGGGAVLKGCYNDAKDFIIMRVKYTPQMIRTQTARNCKAQNIGESVSYGGM